MANGIRTGDPRGFNKGEGSRVRQTPEGRRTYRPKRCENNNKDEDNSPKNLNDKKFSCVFSICRSIPEVPFDVILLLRSLHVLKCYSRIKICWLYSLQCGKTSPHQKTVVRWVWDEVVGLQFRRSKACGVPFHSHYSQVHCDMDW